MDHVLCGNKFRVSVEGWSRSSSMMQQYTIVDINRGVLNDPSADFNNVIEFIENPDFGDKVDILLKYIDRIFSVVEMKRPSFLKQPIDHNSSNLVKAYESKDLQFLDGQRFHILAHTIIQVFRYLVRHSIDYGIISSIDLSYLVSLIYL